jgi:hypothetical protein
VKATSSDKRFIKKNAVPYDPPKPKPYFTTAPPTTEELLRTAYVFLNRLTGISKEDFAHAYTKGGLDLISQMYEQAAESNRMACADV